MIGEKQNIPGKFSQKKSESRSLESRKPNQTGPWNVVDEHHTPPNNPSCARNLEPEFDNEAVFIPNSIIFWIMYQNHKNLIRMLNSAQIPSRRMKKARFFVHKKSLLILNRNTRRLKPMLNRIRTMIPHLIQMIRMIQTIQTIQMMSSGMKSVKMWMDIGISSPIL